MDFQVIYFLGNEEFVKFVNFAFYPPKLQEFEKIIVETDDKIKLHFESFSKVQL